MSKTQVIASIVTYNTSNDKLKVCISSLLNTRLSIKILIRDNASEDPSITIPKHPDIHFFQNKKNVGYGRAHNQNFKENAFSSDYFLVINPDVWYDEDILKILSLYLDTHPNTHLVMPKVLFPDGKVQYLCKHLPSPYILFLRRFHKGDKLHKINYHFEMRYTGYNKEIDVPCLSGCFMFMRSSSYEKIGGFDERFFLYAEDFDLSRRLHKLGPNRFVPSCIVYHEHAQESYFRKKHLFLHISSIIKYFNKWGWW